MEKKIWSKPEMNEVAFAADEYVAACGENGVSYKFNCNAGIEKYGSINVLGQLIGWVGQIWQETNELLGFQHEDTTIDGKTYSADTNLGGYHACDEKHETNAGDEFYDGYYVASNEGYSIIGRYTYDYDKVHEVKIWTGDGDLHATDELDMSTWETAKS